jgi:hypothetical protein
MAKGKKEDQSNSAVADLMQATLITELGRAGVGQAAIRAIVGCGMNRVNQIVKPIERERRRLNKAQTATAIRLEKKLDTIIRFSKRFAS